MFCVCTEVIWDKIIQLLSTNITPLFQVLPMCNVDQTYLRIHEVPHLQ